MHLHRFILNTLFSGKKILIKDPKIIFQIRRVLRLKPGKKIILIDKHGKEVLAKIDNFDNNFIMALPLEVLENKNLPNKEINLYVSILKKNNFELVCEKVTEVGATNIIPLICKNTVKLNIQKERIEKIIKEASEQSGRVFVPKIEEIVNLKNAIENLDKNKLNIAFDPNGENINDFLKNKINFGSANIFIGPEGGWDEKEIQLFKENNFKILKLSNLTLRSETAAIISTYLIATIACG